MENTTNLTPEQYKALSEAVRYKVFRNDDYNLLKSCVSEHAMRVYKRGYKPLALRDLALEYAHRGVRPGHGADLYVAWNMCDGRDVMKDALTVKWQRLTPYEQDIKQSWEMLEAHYIKQLEETSEPVK